MAVLGKRKLTELIETGVLLNNYNLDCIKSASYDLRVGTIYKDKIIYSADYPAESSRIEIKPSEIITLLTLETVKIPNGCNGTVFAINSMSSKGFLILNPGHIDPGYIGPLSICAINLSKNSIFIELKQPIFTLILSTLDVPLKNDELYKKNSFDESKRKVYEKKSFDNKYSNLSNSFFDLISNHKDGKEMLQNILKKSFKDWFYYILKIVGVIVTLMALLKGVDYFYLRSIEAKEKNIIKKDEAIDEKNKMIKEYKLEIENLKKTRDTL